MHKPMLLTDKNVRDLPLVPRGSTPRQYEVRDTELPGFFVRVGITSRTYCVNVEIVGPLRKGLKRVIGDAIELSATKARKAAHHKIVELQKEHAKPVVTADDLRVGAGYDDYKIHLHHINASLKTFDDYRITFEVHLQDWRELPWLAITPKMVRDRHVAVTEKKTVNGRRRGGKTAANHMARNLRAVYNHVRVAHPYQLPIDHPSLAVDFHPPKVSKSAMMMEQLPAWWAQVQTIVNPIQREFQLLTLLTGSRPGVLSEIERVRHISMASRALFLAKPKGGKERAFWVPMSEPILQCVMRLLEWGPAMHQEQAKTWLFPARSGSGHLETWRPKKLTKYGKALRQTFRTAAKKANVDKFYVMLLMNHKLTREGDEVGTGEDVSEDYINVVALSDELREAQDKISAYIMNALLQPVSKGE